MDGDTGEALARSQLARLYRLGVLRQPAGEEENDPHAFLNRLPPPAAHEAAQGDQQTSLQTSGELARKHSRLAPCTSPPLCEPLIPIQTRHVESPPAQRIAGLEQSRVPLSPLPLISGGGRSPALSWRKSLVQGREDRQQDPRAVQQKWFFAWKRRVERKHELARAGAKGMRFVKRRCLGQWRAVAYKRRLTDARCRQLVHWKATRALRSWAVWASLHGRVTWFLTTQGRGFALMYRLRRARTWWRWTEFVLWSQRHHKKRDRATTFRRRCVLRSCWLEWRVSTFHGRRRRVVFRGFMDLVRMERTLRQKRWELAAELHERHVHERLKQLLRRWRLFNDERQREHVRCWRVRMVLSRGKYFTIWNSTLHHVERIHALRERVAQRVKRDHLNAWSVAARAVGLGRMSTLWHPEAILVRYLGVWKRWTCESLRFRKAGRSIHARQRRRALRILRAWGIEHSRISKLQRTADAITRRRIFLRVWLDGLLAYHLKRQQEKAQTKQVRAITQGKVFAMWRLMWSVRHEWRAKKQLAQQMRFRSSMFGVWRAWRHHTKWRRLHKEQLVRAARHHHYHLLLSGLLALSRVVDRKCAQTAAARQVRVSHRILLKRRVLIEWRTHVQRQLVLDEKITQFVSRPRLLRSVWNPKWRWWTRWLRFAHVSVELQRMRFDRLKHLKYRTFQAWRRRAIVASTSRVRCQELGTRRRAAMLASWKRYIAKRREKLKLRLRARRFYRQRCGSDVLSAWREFACRRGLELQRLQQIRKLRDERVSWVYYSRWKTRFCQAHGLRRLEERHRMAWLQSCWDLWHQLHLRYSKRKTKLRYYREVFGQHPSTSPLRRFWLRWKSLVSLQGSVKQLRLQSERRAVKSCFSAWKTFWMVKLILKKWHMFSVAAGAAHNDLGKRRRLFRQHQVLRLYRLIFSTLASATRARHQQQERLALSRRNILHDIRSAQAKRSKYRRCSLRLWFRRWRRRQLADLFSAECWYRARVCLRVFHAWWRQVIHGKQERLLQDTRKTVQNMSANQAQQKSSRLTSDRYTARAKVAPVPRRGRLSLKGKHSVDVRVPVMARLRMIDPEIQPSTYLQRSSRSMLRQGIEGNPTSKDVGLDSRVKTPSQFFQRARAGDINMKPRVSPNMQQHPRQWEPAIQVNELPLYDGESDEQAAIYHVQSSQPVISVPVFSNMPRRLDVDEDEPLLSLESIASMDPYSSARHPTQRPLHPIVEMSSSVAERFQSNAGHQQRQKNTQNLCDRVPTSEPNLFTVDQSLRSQKAVKANPSHRTKPPAKKKPLRANEELSDILDIRNDQEQQVPSVFRSVLEDMKIEDDSRTSAPDVDGVTTMILNYYAAKQDLPCESKRVRVWLETWGFCMLRDLGVFETGCFISAMERAIQRLPTDIQEPKTLLKTLLEDFICKHPSYTATTKTQDNVDPSSWLVDVHLRQRFGKSILCTSTTRAFWIRVELPAAVVMSLPKLLKCFRKYQKQLEQFFTWRPENTSVIRGGLDRSMFLLLMKYCNVHPQLFDRRELEIAFDSGASHHLHTGSELLLNFPQFIEVLVRCALKLQWAEEPSRDAELVVVVKFLMLVFAMEGRGSMLTKRSQDLEVVMGFLQRQQTQAKSAKLRKFQALLRSEALGGKSKATSYKSAFQMAMEGRNSSSRQVDGENEKDLCRHGTLAATSQVGWDHNMASHDRIDSSDHAMINHNDQPRDGIATTTRELQGRRSEDSRRQLHSHNPVDERPLGPSHQDAAEKRDTRDTKTGTAPFGQVETTVERSVQVHGSNPRSDVPLQFDARRTAAENPFLSIAENSGLQLPTGHDAFLNDILSSISDVELLLQQSDIRCPSKLHQASMEPDVPLTSEPFSAAYPARHAVLINGELSSSPGDSLDAGQSAEDIKVRDPVLDHLTFADRFSEAQDWQSSVSIADLAAYGIHSAYPSSMHVLGQLETGELNDLTDPHRTSSLLRADADDLSDLRNY